MVVHSGLMVACLTLPNQLGFLWRGDGTGLPAMSWVAYAGFLLAVGFGIAAHNAYKEARAALAADPALRGAWLVRHLWWVVCLALLVPGLVVLLVAVLLVVP